MLFTLVVVTDRRCICFWPPTKEKGIAMKFFTVDQANNTLPLVRRIVADILRDYEIWRDRMRSYEILSAGETSEGDESPEQISLREEIDRAAHRISRYMEELKQIGCVFKGFEVGLVDFYAKKDGRDVLLCWKYGEDAVEHWHELDAGFAGRQPIEPKLVAEGAW